MELGGTFANGHATGSHGARALASLLEAADSLGSDAVSGFLVEEGEAVAGAATVFTALASLGPFVVKEAGTVVVEVQGLLASGISGTFR